MSQYIRRLGIVIVLSLCLVACQNSEEEDSSTLSNLEGTILIWHTWPEPESLILEQLFNNFTKLHSDVTIVSEFVPSDNIQDRFIDQANSGLGPDLLIGADMFLIKQLLEEDLLLNFFGYGLNTDHLLPQAVDALRIQKNLYAIPFAADTTVLYYNRELIEEPPTLLHDLLQEAKAGQVVALPVNFRDSFWGVKAYGGKVFAEDGTILVDDGIVSWLEWLVEAQNEPTIILSSNYDDLFNAFINEEAAYFIGSSFERPEIVAALGAEKAGIANLPDAVVAAGSFLDIEAIAMSRITAQGKVGRALIEFLINVPNQRIIALSDHGKISMNQNVTFDKRLAPIPEILNRQSVHTLIVPLSQVDIEEYLFDIGDEIYLQVLSGVLEPEEAAKRLSEEVNELARFSNASNN
ncbi:MAG: ABC transporter substrate-binding protein [Chloroflexota bacterium]